MILDPIAARGRHSARILINFLLASVFVIFERILPVRKEQWCFCTWDRHWHTIDNPRAIFETIKHDASIAKVILQKRCGEPVETDGTNIKYVSADSLRGAYYLARCNVLILGYSLQAITSYSRFVKTDRHHVIQLAHGVPLKKIARLFPKETYWLNETNKYSAAVSSSRRDREVMIRAFAPLSDDRVWLTGLPRNDLILMPDENLPDDYRSELARLDHQLGGRRLVLYAPTWRPSTAALYRFSRAEQKQLEQVLQRHNAFLGVRGHSNVRESEAYTEEWTSSSIGAVNDIPDVNLVLRRTDLLITDYSSIYIDFLLLDKSVLHFVYDLDDYLAERGLIYNPSEAFAGPSVRTFDELVIALDEGLSCPHAWLEQRKRARLLFHQHSNASSETVVRNIRHLLAQKGN